ncbi:MAG: autotransporter outer membrane beta-barrel domain-containing protein [Elusimicrobia bacterium]|nr:autotransporter outer membrane beta-barrel domain-containing protein [Elusimicrobiota bacterium]
MVKGAALSFVLVLGGPAAVRAQMLVSSARQMPAGSVKFTLFYQGVQGQELNFKVTGGGSCVGGVAPPASNVAFPCGSSGDVAASADGGMVVLQAMGQPWEGLQYYGSIGVGDLTLRLSSVTATNVLTGDRPGYQYALGTRAILIPDTVVGPAVTLDARLMWQRHHFNRIDPPSGAGAASIDERLDLYQYQVALETSHRFDLPGKWSVEPYGGVKWLRAESSLKDLGNGDRVGGIKDTVTPFVGLVVPIFEREALVAEGSFVDGYHYSAGLQVRF